MLLQLTKFPSFYGSVVFHCVNIYTHTHHIFIYSSVDGHLGSFHILVIVHSTAMNAVVQVSFQISLSFLFGYLPRSTHPL